MISERTSQSRTFRFQIDGMLEVNPNVVHMSYFLDTWVHKITRGEMLHPRSLNKNVNNKFLPFTDHNLLLHAILRTHGPGGNSHLALPCTWLPYPDVSPPSGPLFHLYCWSPFRMAVSHYFFIHLVMSHVPKIDGAIKPAFIYELQVGVQRSSRSF